MVRYGYNISIVTTVIVLVLVAVYCIQPNDHCIKCYKYQT